MPEFVYITGFEHGESPISRDGGGLVSGSSGSPVLVGGALARSGDYSLFIDAVAAGKHVMLPSAPFTGANNPGKVVVGRFYFKFDSFPTANRVMFVGGMFPVDCSMWYTPTGGDNVQMAFDTPGSRLGGAQIVTGTWYRMDFRINCSTSFYTVDWALDGTNYTQNWYSGTASQQFSSMRLGASGALTYKIYFDDVGISITSADYPIGPGKIIGLRPNSDGTHNAGTNIMEDRSGNDIDGSSVYAYAMLNGNPWTTGTVNHVQQAAAGTSNFVEVNFEDAPSGTDVHAVQGYLEYKSATATTNAAAGYIINTDNVSTELWGLPSGTKDYSELNPFHKNAIITPPAGGWTKAAVDGLKARFGYANDASPVPYWINTMLEIEYGEPVGVSPSGIFVTTHIDNSPTLTRSGTIAEFDFETGDFTGWSSVTYGSNQEFGITGSAALANSSYGLNVVHNGTTTAKYASYDLLQAESINVVRARFYFDPNSFATVGKDAENVFLVRNGANGWLFTVNLGRDASENYYINADLYDDVNHPNPSSDVIVSDAPHWVEVIAKRAAGNNISGGYLQLWVDDVSGTAIQGIDNYTVWSSVNNFRFGAIASIEATTSGTYFLDELVVNNTGDYIGPKPGGPSGDNLSASGIYINTYAGNPALAQNVGLQASGIYVNSYVGNPYLNQEHALAASGIYVNTYVGNNSYINQEQGLTASGVVVGSTVGTPSLGHGYNLSPVGIVVGSAVDTPYLNQVHTLVPVGITSSITCGSPYLNQTNDLTSVGITVASTVGTPSISQVHPLVANGLTVNSTVGNPTLSESNALASNGITVSTFVGNPSISQVHGLSAVGISLAAYVGNPFIGQIQGMVPNGLLVSTYVGNPYINQTHLLSEMSMVVNTYVGNPSLGQDRVLTASGIYCNTYVGSPSIEQNYALTANGLVVATYVDNPNIGTEGTMLPIGITVGAFVGTPYINQTHALGSVGISVSSTVGTPSLGQNYVLGSVGISSSITVGTPGMTSGLGMVPTGIDVGGVIGVPGISQTHVFGSGGIGSGPVVGQPGPGQEHILTIGGITISSTVGTPALVSPPIVSALFMRPVFKRIEQGIEKGMVDL